MSTTPKSHQVLLLCALSIMTFETRPSPPPALLPSSLPALLPFLSPRPSGPNRCTETDRNESRLFAVVVHIGKGPNHGHYVAVVKSGGRWLLFDDEIVELVNEQVGWHAVLMPSSLASPAGGKPPRLRFFVVRA